MFELSTFNVLHQSVV